MRDLDSMTLDVAIAEIEGSERAYHYDPQTYYKRYLPPKKEPQRTAKQEKVNMTEISQFPEYGFVRLKQVLKVIPVSRSTWWAWVKDGKAPQPVKLGPKTTAWKVEDIRALINTLSANGARDRS